MKVKFAFTILVLTLLLMPSFNDLDADWADPNCAPPGCNRPEPITVEGGTIMQGYNLTIQGAGSGGDTDTVLSSDLVTIGTDLTSTYNAQEEIQVVEYKSSCGPTSYPTRYWGADNCFELVTYPANSGKEVSFFSKKIIPSDGIALTKEANITLPGGGRKGAIEVSNTMNDWYGYGIHARSLTPKTDVPESSDLFRNYNPAIWGQSYTSPRQSTQYYRNNPEEAMLGQMFSDTKEFLKLPDEHNFAIFAQSLGPQSIGLHTRSHSGGLGAYMTGGTLITGATILNLKIWYRDMTGTNNGGLHMALHGHSSNGYDPNIEYRPLEISALAPDKVFIGGILPNGDDAQTIQLCLNNDCITEWPSPGGGINNLQAVTTAGATTNQAVTISNDLTISGNYKDLIFEHSSTNRYNQIYFKSKVNYPSDYGYIRYYDDNNDYDWWGGTGENSALIVGVQNDGANRYSDVVVLKSPAAVVIDSPRICLGSSCITSWPSGGGGVQYAFKKIDASSGSDPIADSAADTLKISGGYRIRVTGSKQYDRITISYSSWSSERYKDNIKPLQDDFAKILQAEPKSFVFKETGDKDIGFIAEDFAELGLDNLVIYDEQGRPDGLQYDKISLYLLEVVKEQQRQLDYLTKLIE